MIVLGINGGWGGGYQDTAAALMKDGRLVAAVEEERLSRVKFAPGQLPLRAITEVLQIAEIDIKDVDVVASHGATWSGNKEEKLRRYFDAMFGCSPEVRFYHHHDAHAASAYFASGFKEALSVSLDNSGDGVSTQVTVFRENEMEVLKRYSRPQSLGIFYSAMTQYAGFTRDSDEYKLMGLAPYGKKESIDLQWLLNWDGSEYRLDENGIIPFENGKPSPSRLEMLYSSITEEKIGFPRRKIGQQINEDHKNLAAAAQYRLEEVVSDLIVYYVRETGIRNVCLSGGVAFNCAMNGKLLKLDEIDQVYVPPFAGDMGIPVGAAALATLESSTTVKLDTTVYLGKEFSNEEIVKTLQQTRSPFKKINDPVITASELLAAGKIIAWFQGKAEFGPRALGNRSILADASISDIKDRINATVKFREGFRPFAPVLREEDLPIYFESNSSSPHMAFVFSAKQGVALKFQGVVHADNTARLQTVNKQQNFLLYNLLENFATLKGHGILVNTSFNSRNQPMVYSPIDAIETFYSSGLDALVIGNFLLTKETA